MTTNLIYLELFSCDQTSSYNIIDPRAKLELVPQEQKAFEVNVAVQVEGSERKQGKFSCDELLINIIQSKLT